MIANTIQPPYYAVIFSSIRTNVDDGYDETAELMERLAQEVDGYLGIETAKNELGITVSYWRDLVAIANWKQQIDHVRAQEKGKQAWYAEYKVRIAKVERDYDFTVDT